MKRSERAKGSRQAQEQDDVARVRAQRQQADAGDAGDDKGGEDAGEQRGRASSSEKVGAVADLLAGLDAGGRNVVKKKDGGKPEEDKGDDKGAGDGQDGQGDDAGEDKGDDKGGDAGERQQAQGKPKSWKEAAERLGLEPEELYALELDLSGGKGKATLGQIKDFLQEHGVEAAEISQLIGSSRTATEAAERVREQAVAEANTVRRDLVGIVGALGRVPPAMLDAVRTFQARRMEGELGLTLASAPEWRDAKIYAQDKADIAKILKPYGFSSSELDGVDDSRLMLFLRDQLRARRAAQRALDGSGENHDEKTRHDPNPAGRSSLHNAQRQAQQRAAGHVPGGRQGKVAAVSALLSKR